MPIIPETWIDAIDMFGAFVIVVLLIRLLAQVVDRTFGIADRLTNHIAERDTTKGEEDVRANDAG